MAGATFHHLPEILGPRELSAAVFNRLQEPALKVSVKMKDVWLATAHEPDVLVRFVSGSGSTVAFLVADQAAARKLADSLTARSLGRAYAVRTLPG